MQMWLCGFGGVEPCGFRAGEPAFLKVATEFVYGNDSTVLKEGRVAAAQALSGTGSLRVGYEFLRRYLPAGTAAYTSSPTWTNHLNIIKVRVDMGCVGACVWL